MAINIKGKTIFGVAPPAPFSPSDISGLQLWLDGDNPSNTDARWYDKSTNNYTIEQTNAALQPTYSSSLLNGHGGYTFDGSVYLDGGTSALNLGTDNWTWFVVGKSLSNTGTYFAKSLYGDANYRYSVLWAGGLLLLYQGEITTQVVIANDYDIWELLRFERNSTSVRLYRDGILKTDVSKSTTENFTSSYNFLVGAYNGEDGTTFHTYALLNGYITEIIAYNSSLSDSDKEKVETYLQNKYGL